ncbi:MAG: hypothetical protein ACM3VZ_10300 [Acidobacteriota bacterium]
MEVFLVYLWLKLDTVLIVMCTCGVLMLISPAFYAMSKDLVWKDEEIRRIELMWPIYKRAFISGCVILILCTVLPSSKQTAILVGTSYAVDLAKSPEGVKVVSLIRKKANEYLDEELKDAKKDAAK